jgi:hypothetical protein
MKKWLKIVLIVIAVLFVLFVTAFLAFYIYDKRNSCENINFNESCTDFCETNKNIADYIKTNNINGVESNITEGVLRLASADFYNGTYRLDLNEGEGVIVACYCGEIDFYMNFICR